MPRAPSRARTWLLAVAAVRAVLALIAIPLAPVLFRDHFVVLVLLRPTKEVLLAGGFLVRRGDVGVIPLLLAALPLAVFGVWLFFAIGRAFAPEISAGEGLPRWAQRFLPVDRIQQMCGLLGRKGTRLVVGGRVAAFPSTMLAAAAGASSMESRRFLAADALGAALSITEVVAAGYVLGSAYKQAGPWVTAVGVVVLAALLVYVGRSLRSASS